MTNPPGQRRGKTGLILAALGVAALLCWRFPLFHVVSLKRAQQEQKTTAFNAAAFAGEFWDAKLLPATDRAVEAKDLLTALAKDSASARKQYGRSLGLSGAAQFFVKGSGRVTAIEEDGIRVAVDGAPDETGVSLATGLLFGNAVRDATGLLDVSAYPNSQDFNDISTELNRIVETKVTPALREKSAAGKAIRFAGCLELDEDAKPDSLQIVPVKTEWP